ncbi:MAG: hypothetical protein JJU11_13515 [Candidatus Sumerlaeia bacterium]|nr:hypothetical protein [Candidatus Sumerlaeia bacterium]
MSPVTQLQPPIPSCHLGPVDVDWVESRIKSLNIREKIGQLIVSSRHQRGELEIEQFHVGGFVFLGNGQRAADIVATTNRLQAFSPNPVWFSIDAETGLGSRVADATVFPTAMALGAAGDPELARAFGTITAMECRSLGIHIAYCPVLDVNTAPKNPIISTRSFSSDADSVTAMARVVIHGLRGAGVFPTTKHYPGHGSTDTDSHNVLPEITRTAAELQSVDLKPFRDLSRTGDLDLVMTAHVWVSDIDRDTPIPATLSSRINREILRKDFGFDGIIVSDAFNMAGLEGSDEDEGELAVRAMEAGVDVLVAPVNTGVIHGALLRAVESGRLRVEDIDTSVRRILMAKSRLGLVGDCQIDPESWKGLLNRKEHLETVNQIAEKSFTKIAYRPETSPFLVHNDSVLTIVLKATQLIFYRYPMTPLLEELDSRLSKMKVIHTDQSISPKSHQEILEAAKDADKVLVVGYDWTHINHPSQVDLINELVSQPTRPPVGYVSFGAPYHLHQIPNVDAFFCGYATTVEVQQVAARVLTGEMEARGVLPVQL